MGILDPALLVQPGDGQPLSEGRNLGLEILMPARQKKPGDAQALSEG